MNWEKVKYFAIEGHKIRRSEFTGSRHVYVEGGRFYESFIGADSYRCYSPTVADEIACDWYVEKGKQK